MTQNQTTELVYLRYHLENNAPVDLLDFTDSLLAIQSEYSHFLKQRGLHGTNARLNIKKVEEGSIVFELMEAAIPAAIVAAGNANTLIDFGKHLKDLAQSLTTGSQIPAEGYNPESLSNISKIVQALARNPDSNLGISVMTNGGQTIFNNCTFNLDSTEGNALQNRAQGAKEMLKESISRTEESKEHVLLRLARLDREADSKQDRGIIEAFEVNKARKLLFDDDSIKARFMESDQNAFKCLYYVDAVAMYQEGRIIAYRITNLHEVFEPEA